MAAPYRYICHLEYDGRNMGTGTLIGPTTVVTAAHCLWDETQTPQRQYDPRLMSVIPGRNGGARPFGTAQAVGFRFSPGFRGSADYASPRDYGVIYLREPVGERVGYWTIAHTSSPRDPLGTSISAAPLPMRVSALPVNLSGYPDDKCRRRAVEVQRQLVATIERLRPGHSRNVQIVVQSLGEARPIAVNTTPQGRARNRRVEVFLAAR